MDQFLIIPDVLRYNARAYPTREAIVFPDYKQSVTFDEIDQNTDQFACFLFDLKIKKGQCVGMLLKDSRKASLAFLSLAKIGASAVPLDPDSSKDRVKEAALFLDIQYFLVEEKYRSLVDNDHIQVIVLKEQEGITFLPPQVSAMPKQWQSPVVIECQDDLICMSTSGSTGHPKVVRMAHQGIIANALAVKEHLRITDGDRFLSLTPMSHAHGFYNGLLMPMCCGASSIMIDAMTVFHVPQFWNTVKDHRISIVNIVPTIVEMLINMKAVFASANNSTLRFMICGTAPLKEERRDIFESTNGVKVICQYGLTETLINAIELLDGRRVIGSVGKPVGVKIQILDERFDPLPVNSVGEIAISGPSVTRGYYGQDGLNQTVFHQGSFLTGDLGRLDNEGFLFIEGRKKDLIIKGGKNIAPIEVERVLLSHPAVEEASVVGLADDFYGEEIYAFVTLKDPEAIEQELLVYCQKRIPLFLCPKGIFMLDQLPKGPTGKFQKNKLKEIGERILAQGKGVVRGAID